MDLIYTALLYQHHCSLCNNIFDYSMAMHYRMICRFEINLAARTNRQFMALVTSEAAD